MSAQAMSFAVCPPQTSCCSAKLSAERRCLAPARQLAHRTGRSRSCYPKTVCMAAADAAMQEAERRWSSQVTEGKVKNLTSKSAGDLLKDGWVLLDVRPEHEVARGGVKEAVEVPLFVTDTEKSVGTLLKHASSFGMGGWWVGGSHMIPNPSFLGDVQAKIPKDAKVIVGCQKGLRSLAACEQLFKAGYTNLAWINGGFDTTVVGDLPVVNAKFDDVRYAGLGGVSEFLGWTEVQQAHESKGIMGGGGTIIKLAVLVLALDAALFAYEQTMYFMNK